MKAIEHRTKSGSTKIRYIIEITVKELTNQYKILLFEPIIALIPTNKTNTTANPIA